MPDLQTPHLSRRARAIAMVTAVVVVIGAVLLIVRPWDKTTDVSDPATYNSPVEPRNVAIVNGPRFNCAVNDGKPRNTQGEADKLVPCWNQSFHVLVGKDGQPQIGEFTKLKSAATVQRLKVAEYSTYKTVGNDTWVFSALLGDDGRSTYDFKYLHDSFKAATHGDWEIYYRIGGSSQPWRATGSFEDRSTQPGEEMEAILVFTDPTQSADLVRAPFDWKDVPKSTMLPHFNQN